MGLYCLLLFFFFAEPSTIFGVCYFAVLLDKYI